MFAYHQQCNHVRNSEIEGVTQNYARDSPIVLLYVCVFGFFLLSMLAFFFDNRDYKHYLTTDKDIFLLLL